MLWKCMCHSVSSPRDTKIISDSQKQSLCHRLSNERALLMKSIKILDCNVNKDLGLDSSERRVLVPDLIHSLSHGMCGMNTCCLNDVCVSRVIQLIAVMCLSSCTSLVLLLGTFKCQYLCTLTCVDIKEGNRCQPPHNHSSAFIQTHNSSAKTKIGVQRRIWN
jgi:hypothetical protein